MSRRTRPSSVRKLPSLGTAAAASSDGEPPSRRPDAIALAQLWAHQFQHLTTLGVAGAGGVLILLQAELIPSGERWRIALGLFVVTAIFSMYGQISVVDQASLGQAPGRRPRLFRAFALTCLGAAGGAAIATLGL